MTANQPSLREVVIRYIGQHLLQDGHAGFSTQLVKPFPVTRDVAALVELQAAQGKGDGSY
jgi:hypothetical protein